MDENKHDSIILPRIMTMIQCAALYLEMHSNACTKAKRYVFKFVQVVIIYFLVHLEISRIVTNNVQI